MAKKSEHHELVEGLVTENIALSATIDRLSQQNEHLLQYIVFFHEQMEEVSNRMQEKTNELFGKLLTMIRGEQDDE